MTREDDNRDPHLEDAESGETLADLLPAYALGVLDEDERLGVEAELARSEDARQQLRRWQSTVDALDLSTPREIPGDRLRDRILGSASGVASSPEPTMTGRGRMVALRPLAAAAALVVVVLGAAIVALALELRNSDARISELEAAATPRQGPDFNQPLVWTEIAADQSAEANRGYFCRTEDGSVGWIVIEDLHGPDDHIFQMWLVNDDQMVSAGTFATDHAGRGFGVVRADDPVQSFRQIWITVEPPGGSPSPSSQPDVAVPIT